MAIIFKYLFIVNLFYIRKYTLLYWVVNAILINYNIAYICFLFRSFFLSFKNMTAIRANLLSLSA